MPPKKPDVKIVATLTHGEARRVIIPTSELSGVARKGDIAPIRVAYQRRDSDLDPQLIWRGKYAVASDQWPVAGEATDHHQPATDHQPLATGFTVKAAPLYIQEKVHPKVLIDDLKRESEARVKKEPRSIVMMQSSLFADFNGVPEGVDKTEFYQHEQNWSNRMILGDSLQVMAGLSEREGLRGKVQCIYFDPPYGIKFNSNFQWSTTSRDVKDNKADHITREPEQVKAFRDTWRDGIHSYLSYIRDRLVVARDLLTDSGSIFVQIGDENVHRVRAVMDEVFGEENCVAVISFKKSGAFDTNYLQSNFDHIVWFSKQKSILKFRSVPDVKEFTENDLMFFDTVERAPFERTSVSSLNTNNVQSILKAGKLIARNPLNSDGWIDSLGYGFDFEGTNYTVPKNRHWTTTYENLCRLGKANRLIRKGNTLRFARLWEDYATQKRNNVWLDTAGGGFVGDARIYVVQTDAKVIQRCILMSTDPGDLVLDPTCGSGTTATVAEQWGRRWITIDTSRVALALARARLMGARYPYYLLSDSPEGQKKEAEITQTEQSARPTYGKLSHGFVYERVPHITLKSIANNAEIDVIWEKWQEKLEPLRQKLNAALGQTYEEWEIPREAEEEWPKAATKLHADWWQARIARQKEMDASIAARAEFEFLYDKPYTDNKKVRVAGPFTVESLSPHRMLAVDENDELIDPLDKAVRDGGKDFTSMILDELKTAGVQQANKEDKITFTTLKPWPGRYISAEGIYQDNGQESDNEHRAAVFIGPEFSSVTRTDLVAAAREAADADFDVLIACAFNYDAASSDLPSLGRMRILKARMNADLHMSADLKNTGKGNLFVIFGEPDIKIIETARNQIQVEVLGVDVFDPTTGEVRSDDPDNIACWFVDTDYNEESFFVRHAYFLGANDPYKSLKTSLKAEIDHEAWESLHSDTSRPFDKPKSGRIAVKVINHLGDEVMKVYKIS